MINEHLKNRGQGRHFFKCSVCTNDSFKMIYRFADETVRVCKNCGTVCLNSRLNEKAYEEYFRTQYYREGQSRVLVDKEYGNIKPNSRAATIFNDIQEYVQTSGKFDIKWLG